MESSGTVGLALLVPLEGFSDRHGFARQAPHTGTPENSVVGGAGASRFLRISEPARKIGNADYNTYFHRGMGICGLQHMALSKERVLGCLETE